MGLHRFVWVTADVLDIDTDGDTAEPLPLDADGVGRFVDDPAVTYTVVAAGLPPGRFGILCYGPDATRVPLGDGFLCVAPGTAGIFRLPRPVFSDPAGATARTLDLTQPPLGGGAGRVLPGSIWHFQLWYRDTTVGGGSGSNLSDALSIAFCP
ncbi:MAG: hypothetical protein GY711_23845 [bacterium]|nr:hypothetical protein [bacterium]